MSVILQWTIRKGCREKDRRGTGHFFHGRTPSGVSTGGMASGYGEGTDCREEAVVGCLAVMPSAAGRFRFPGAPARDAHEEIPGRGWRIIGRVRRLRLGPIAPAAMS